MSHGCMMNTKAYKYTRVYCPKCWPCHLDLGIDLDVCSAGAVNEKNNEDHLQPSWKFVVLFIFPLIVILYNECIFCLAGKSLMKKPETRNARCRCTEVARVTDIWADLDWEEKQSILHSYNVGNLMASAKKTAEGERLHSAETRIPRPARRIAVRNASIVTWIEHTLTLTIRMTDV